MADIGALDTIRGLYDYHRWANRRLYGVAAALGDEVVGRDVGPQFSYPTVRRMLAHLYGADAIWLARWTGQPLATIPGADITTLGELRRRWDDMEGKQQAFLRQLTPADLGRVVEYKNAEGKTFRVGLWPALQHVVNHATHHRSEIATMITMISGSPPDSGLVTYLLVTSGQLSS
jgi:uncharacterized damage-inducible protein DinB